MNLLLQNDLTSLEFDFLYYLMNLKGLELLAQGPSKLNLYSLENFWSLDDGLILTGLVIA